MRLWAAMALGLAFATQVREAEACGGCFAPPGAIQTVTAHRMVLSVSSEQTTLWDQFSYSGTPSEFSWILPIRNGPNVQVRLADDRFMTLVDNLTAPVLNTPTPAYLPCPCDIGFSEDGNASPTAAGSADAGVTVHREEVVGPYAVAVIGGSNAMAIRDWLRSNGFSVPSAIEPIIDHYTAMRTDYVALRLRPGVGLNRMSPVRVTTPGFQPLLPLRMIAAGVADKVGLQLTVFANTRTEAQNFPNGEIQESDLVYDFATPTSPAQDFLAAFERINRANMNRVWLAETVLNLNRDSTVNQAMNFTRVQPRDGGVCDPSDGGTAEDGGMPSPCMEPDPAEDARVAFQGLNTTATVTRLRANLAGGMLDRDLTLQSSTRPLRERTYRYGTVRNTPAPTYAPWCPVNTPYCTSPSRRDAGARDGSSVDAGPTSEVPVGGGIRCSVGWNYGPSYSLFGVAGAAALMLARRSRRARKSS